MHGSDSPGGGIWLVFLKSIKDEFIEDYFKGINTPFDVQLIIAELQSNEVRIYGGEIEKKMTKIKRGEKFNEEKFSKVQKHQKMTKILKTKSIKNYEKPEKNGQDISGRKKKQAKIPKTGKKIAIIKKNSKTRKYRQKIKKLRKIQQKTGNQIMEKQKKN